MFGTGLFARKLLLSEQEKEKRRLEKKKAKEQRNKKKWLWPRLPLATAILRDSNNVNSSVDFFLCICHQSATSPLIITAPNKEDQSTRSLHLIPFFFECSSFYLATAPRSSVSVCTSRVWVNFNGFPPSSSGLARRIRYHGSIMHSVISNGGLQG